MTGVPRSESAPEALRAFFAIELGSAARRSADAVARALSERKGGASVSWVRPENYHVTLRFLGQLAHRAVPDVVRHVEAATRRQAAFTLGLGAASGLPSVRRPRVVVLGLVPREPLEELARAVERGVQAAGFAPESRSFRPHMTLGRVRRGAPSLADPPTPAPSPFDVRDLVLFRSHLPGRRGRAARVTYEPLERIALAEIDHPANHPVEGRQNGQ